MADLKFTCTHCGQDIECDELWSGHEIQCPTCKKELTVPPKPDEPPHATFAAAKPGQARLSIGTSRDQHATSERPVAPQAAALEQKLVQAKSGRGGGARKWIVAGVVVVVLGVGAYLGYPYLQQWQAKRGEAAKAASTKAAQPDAAASGEATPAPAPKKKKKELPTLPAVWTLDADKARIPEGKANGMIAGTNFVVETARLDMAGNICLLRLLQGSTAAPSMGFMVYLPLNAKEGVTGRTWTVSQEMKGRAVPQVVKLWKTNPRYPAQQKRISSGYAMKLELGAVTNGTIPGRIFLAVPPDTERSVVAGVFKAATSLADAAGATTASPAPEAGAAPAAAPAAEPANFEQRYGVKH